MNYLDGYVSPLALEESNRARDVEERWFVNSFFTFLSQLLVQSPGKFFNAIEILLQNISSIRNVSFIFQKINDKFF